MSPLSFLLRHISKLFGESKFDNSDFSGRGNEPSKPRPTQGNETWNKLAMDKEINGASDREWPLGQAAKKAGHPGSSYIDIRIPNPAPPPNGIEYNDGGYDPVPRE